MDYKNLLKISGLSKDMTDEEVQALVSIAQEQHFARGAEIIREDSRSRDLFIICKGRVSIRLSLPTEVGKEEIIYSMRDGQIFGELSLVDGSPRSATVRADEEVVACMFEYQKLSALLEQNPRIGYLLMRNIAAIISTRVRNTNLLWRNSLIW